MHVCGNHFFLSGIGIEVAIGTAMGAEGDVKVKTIRSHRKSILPDEADRSAAQSARPAKATWQRPGRMFAQPRQFQTGLIFRSAQRRYPAPALRRFVHASIRKALP